MQTNDQLKRKNIDVSETQKTSQVAPRILVTKISDKTRKKVFIELHHHILFSATFHWDTVYYTYNITLFYCSY